MTKIRLAHLTSNVFNPFLVSSLVIVLISSQVTETFAEAAKWTLISVLLSIFPVLGIVLYLVRKGSVDSIFINARQERSQVYILSMVCLIVSAVTLFKLGAPPMLMATFVASITSAIVFMFINLLWKISVHTAFVAASVTMLIIVFGTAASVSAFLVPLTGWSRIELKLHSLAQVVSGGVLAAGIAFFVFYSSGLV